MHNITKIEKTKKNLWKCQCGCGKIFTSTEEQIKKMNYCKMCERLLSIKYENFKIVDIYRKKSENDGERIFCICKCVCGKQFIRRSDYLEKTKCIVSCGCKNPNRNKGKENSGWKGIGDLSSFYYSTIKHRAEKKKIEFSVSKEFLWGLFLKQDKKCKLSNIDIHLSQSVRCRDEQTASIDRIDSSKGYTEDNVQWVHKDINLMKNVLEEKYFIELCKLVYENAL